MLQHIEHAVLSEERVKEDRVDRRLNRSRRKQTDQGDAGEVAQWPRYGPHAGARADPNAGC